jgi:hypothetical protein
MSDVRAPAPQRQWADLSELERRRALASIRGLIDLAVREPVAAAQALTSLAATPTDDPYPVSAGVIYLLGRIAGACHAAQVGGPVALGIYRKNEVELLGFRVDDYMGPRRKCLRGGGA